MAYSYSVINPAGYQDVSKAKQASPLPAAGGGLIAGGSIGAFAALKKNNITDKLGIKDSFTQKVQENLLKEAGESSQNTHKQTLEIIRKINKVKTPEDLKTLFESNKDAAKKLCEQLKQTPEEFLRTITSDNLKKNKETIKHWFEAEHNNQFQALKNKIQFCWDKESKKFIKSSAVKENIYNAIIKTQKQIKKISTLKYASIGAVIGAVSGYIFSKLTQ